MNLVLHEKGCDVPKPRRRCWKRMIGLLNLSVLGYSFVFHDKGKNTESARDDGKGWLAWSGVLSMKKAREDPQERLSTDTTTPKMIDASNRPGNNKNRSILIFPFYDLCWNWWQVESHSEVHSRSRIRTSPRVPPRPEFSPPIRSWTLGEYSKRKNEN